MASAPWRNLRDGFLFLRQRDRTSSAAAIPPMEEALFFTRFAPRVTLINRTERFRAEDHARTARAHPSQSSSSPAHREMVLGVEKNDVKASALKIPVSGIEHAYCLRNVPRHRPHPNATAFKGMMESRTDGLHYDEEKSCNLPSMERSFMAFRT